jgi:hypothetical protein
MSGFTGSPRLVKGGIVVADAGTLAVRSVITLQYNPDSVTRTLTPQGAAAGAHHSEALRLTGPAVETLRVEAELDATDALEQPERNATTVELGLLPALAVLEALVNPRAADLVAADGLARAGLIELVPAPAPLTIFVWGAQRIVPVRITELGVVEDAFDPALNPMRAKVTLGLRVLSVDDLGHASAGGALFLGALQRRERHAGRAGAPTLAALGIGGLR